MLLDDIISLLNETVRKAHVTDDEPIDRRIFQDWIMIQRNIYIKNYMNDKGNYEQNALQFEMLDLSDYNPALTLGGVSLGNKILRSTKCPTLIEGKIGVAVYELSTPDMIGKTIQNVSFDRLRWCGNGITNKDTIYAAFYDGYFYVKSNSGKEKPLTKLRVVGVFADPTLVSTYVRATDDYPVNDYMIGYMNKAILGEDFGTLKQGAPDVQNNATGEVLA